MRRASAELVSGKARSLSYTRLLDLTEAGFGLLHRFDRIGLHSYSCFPLLPCAGRQKMLSTGGGNWITVYIASATNYVIMDLSL